MARPIAGDHDDKRAAILAAAAKVIARQGYDRASMARVAAGCAISKANIYHYYGSKEALVFDLLDRHLSGLADRICGMKGSPGDPAAAFRAALAEILRAYRGADDAHRVQTSAMAHLGADRRAELVAHQRRLVAHVTGLIAPLVPPETAKDAARMRALTMSVFGMLNWFYMWNMAADEAARASYADLVADLCLKGFAAV